ncbi:MAG: T9SS type A sorting domain-containing protein [Bacteroidales bacterium]|nr:T9SS type A sorting domain-containing protein [Bacteroidales bacterium]
MRHNRLIVLAIALSLGFVGRAQGNFTERDTTDVLHYTICLDLGHHQPRHIQGWCEVTLRLLQPSTEVGLGLMAASIDSVLVNGVRVSDSAFGYDQSELRIPIGNAAVGDTMRLKVHYGSYGWVGSDGGFWCGDNLFYNLGEDRMVRPFSMGRSWFPCSDSVYDRATYTFHITVPPAWTAVCSGEQTGLTTHADSSRTFHFELSHPISTYQVGINAAPYQVYSFEAEGLYGRYPVQVACRNRSSSQIAQDFGSLNQTLQLYERFFGPYSWGDIRFSEGGPGAGMEHVNNICITFDYYDIQYLIDHEFAHQWFGNQVTCARLEDMWFNEGGATFADQLASINRGNMYSPRGYKKQAIVLTPLDEGGYHPLCGMPNQYSFMHTTYYKGALVFHQLRLLLGDSIFFATMQTLLHRNAYSNLDSYQLRDSMSAYCGRDITDFYDFHIFGTGFASYGVDSLKTADGITHIWLSQRLWHASDYCRQANVPVTFFSAQGDTTTCMVYCDGRYSEGEFRLPFTPKFALVDYVGVSANANFSDRLQLTSTQRLTDYYTQMTILPENINDTVNMYVGLQYGYPEEAQIPGVMRWDYRRWYINGDYDNNFKAKTGFCFGNTYPVYDDEFYQGSATRDSLRLFYRKDASQPWKMRKSATVEYYSSPLGGRTYYMQIVGTPLKGEFILAVVDTALLDIDDCDESVPAAQAPKLSVSPNPASSFVKVAFNADKMPAGEHRLTVMDATGKRVIELRPDSPTTSIQTKTWPSGIYFVTLTNPYGSTTKKIIIQ